MAGEQEAYVRIKFLVNSFEKNEPFSDCVEIFDYEFFELGFSSDYRFDAYSVSDDISENIYHNDEFFLEALKEAKHKTTGFYEIYGLYKQEWESSYDYWSGATEWDCHWDIVDYKIHKFNKLDTKQYLERLYVGGNRLEIMNLIKLFDLEKELNKIRKYSGELMENDLFTYDENLDKIEISLIN